MVWSACYEEELGVLMRVPVVYQIAIVIYQIVATTIEAFE